MHPDVLSKGDAPADGGADAAMTDSGAFHTRPTTLARRVRGAVVAAIAMAMLLVGWNLSPDGTGYGTHRQMGLPGCGMMISTGWPCPSCGMTTAVTATVHGELGIAMAAQPFGIVLAVGAAVFAVAGLVEAATGRTPRGIFGPRWWYLLIAVGGMFLGWAVKLAIGLADGTYPVR